MKKSFMNYGANCIIGRLLIKCTIMRVLFIISFFLGWLVTFCNMAIDDFGVSLLDCVDSVVRLNPNNIHDFGNRFFIRLIL